MALAAHAEDRSNGANVSLGQRRLVHSTNPVSRDGARMTRNMATKMKRQDLSRERSQVTADSRAKD